MLLEHFRGLAKSGTAKSATANILADLCWNIADIKIGENKFIPLEQDSINVVESLGGKYKGIYKMLMTRMMMTTTVS